MRFSRGKEEHDALSTEIESLRTRRSNIPARQIAMRAALCEALDLSSETDMPFAGELLQVREDERDWEGAAERLLRGFGLSLLVPDAHYARVASWVDGTHLAGRLVYFRVREARDDGRRDRDATPRLHPDSLVRKLSVKPDSAFYRWLERELARRFDVACCADQKQFRRETHAVTRAGQIKAAGERHEKDDRHRIDDRSRYVLGWTNAAKIDALESRARRIESELGELGARIAGMQGEQRGIRERLDSLSGLKEYTEFREIDWRVLAAEIERLRDEERQLAAESDVLARLRAQLAEVTERLATTEKEVNAHREARAKTEQKQQDAKALREQTRALLEGIDPASEPLRSRFERLGAMQADALGEQTLTVESCDNREQDMRHWLQTRIDSEDHRLKRLRDRIIQAMMAFREAFKAETAEVDASVEAGFEYRAMLDRLKADDLPRFEARFKELLNENTIREVANFQSQLARERETIRERIARINTSMGQIDFNPGRYIRLEARTAPDADIRDFQAELRACTEGALTGSEDAQYSETKFLQVRTIIERFRGREGRSELDARWTARVTDVRNWFVFAASERWREDDVEHEHYSDTGGKSGGQKEEARLHHSCREPRLPVRTRLVRGSLALVPLRADRRGVRAGLGRVHAVRSHPVLEAQPAAPDRHPAAEDPRHRALRVGRRVRPQRERSGVEAAQSLHPGVSRGEGDGEARGMTPAARRAPRAAPTSPSAPGHRLSQNRPSSRLREPRGAGNGDLDAPGGPAPTGSSDSGTAVGSSRAE